MADTGKVYLVGAGPGDPGLCTVRGVELLRAAGAVVYDFLIDDRLLAEANPDAEMIFVGKRAGQHTMPQGEINRLLVKLSGIYATVVRLKGGDPFVFGRGGEEALELSAANVPFEIVPGITAGVAVPAYAGIPFTHRGIAASGLLVTGHEDPTKDAEDLDWIALAPTNATLAFYMSVRNIDRIAERLIRAGRDAATPAALVQWGATPAQRTLTTRLDEIAERAETEAFDPPAVFLVGKVVSLRDRLRWFDNRPLFGKRIVVTRSRAQRSTLTSSLAVLGADVMEIPTIDTAPPDSYDAVDTAIRGMSRYDWIALTSQNAVSALFERLEALTYDARLFSGIRFAVVGDATARVLRERGIRADLEPKLRTSEGLLQTFDAAGVDLSGARVLFPCSDIAGPTLVEGFASRGASAERIVVYRTLLPVLPSDPAPFDPKPDLVTFTSSSTVENFVALLKRIGCEALLGEVDAASIGPVTTETARHAGIDVVVEADSAKIPELVTSIERYFSNEGVAR